MVAHLLIAALVVTTQAPRPAECWIGTSGAGGTLRRVLLELNAPQASSRLTVLQRSMDPRPVSGLRDSAGTVAFTLTAAQPTTFTGRRSPDGQSIVGEITTAAAAAATAPSAPRPVTLRRVSAADSTATPLHGYWAGQLAANGFPMRLVLRFNAAPCGTTHLLLDSPDQATTDLPATTLNVRGDSVHFGFEYMNATFDGVLDQSRTGIKGIWRQSGATMDLTVSRSDSVRANRRPQDPVPPFPYRSEDVRFESSGLTFSGTLTMPPGPGPHPAVLLLSGSGAQDRNETVAGHRPFLVLADALTRGGIAVLRVDDRGIGGSGGRITDATIDDNARDAMAALRLLAGHPAIDSTRLGLLGHSEGGWVAPVVATRDRRVSYIVMLAGPTLRGDTLMLAQQRALSTAVGEPEEVIGARRDMSAAMFAILRETSNESVAGRRADSAMAAMRQRATGRRRTVLDSLYGPTRSGELANSWAIMRTRWFRDLVAFDPAPYLGGLRVPVLALFGERDLQVPASVNADAMRAAARRAGNRDATITIFPGLNHLFQHASTGLLDEYAKIDETIAPEVLRTIVEWMSSRTMTTPAGASRP